MHETKGEETEAVKKVEIEHGVTWVQGCESLARSSKLQNLFTSPVHLTSHLPNVLDTTAFLSLPPKTLYRLSLDALAWGGSLGEGIQQPWSQILASLSSNGEEEQVRRMETALRPLLHLLHRAYSRACVWLEGRFRLLPSQWGTSLWVDACEDGTRRFGVKPGEMERQKCD